MTKKQIRLNPIRTPDRLIRLPEVIDLTGYTKPSIYRLMKLNQFPQSVKLGERAVAWRESSIFEWIDSRLAA